MNPEFMSALIAALVAGASFLTALATLLKVAANGATIDKVHANTNGTLAELRGHVAALTQQLNAAAQQQHDPPPPPAP